MSGFSALQRKVSSRVLSAADLDSDEKFSLYCQLARMVMHENEIKFESHYVDLPNGEQLNPWFARINPKMIIPSVEIGDGEVINDSRIIMKHFDDKCPANQEKRVEEIMDICYSCDLGWFSTVAMKKHIWLWKMIQESLIDENPDLRDVYLEKLATSEKDVSAAHNLTRREPVQKCLNDLAEVLKSRKPQEWASGPVFTRADASIAIYVRWVKWQLAWDSSLLELPPSLEKFYEEVKERPSFVKTLDVDIKWVGFYWDGQLRPVQRALAVAAFSVLVGISYNLYSK
ncbi:hypothetical protein THAOC_19391 [Thalassiosira oceanica]|uniref:GST N-terminal domain-containing protein n=1 Tax=Thalassiosira oceanica TaxID=159749 RepID=K0SPF0_THAOC|nr:hypothetical protein THAOC_19391 [Thalassiosira oceanica]|eukprot:EJK60282.1 hypothetical protein THAOC_19391 [Thalassiosira oceanica]